MAENKDIQGEQNENIAIDANEKNIVSDSSENTSETPPLQQKKSTWKKWLKRLLISLLLLLIILISIATWLVRTPSGLRFAAVTIPSWFNVTVETQTLNGTIWEGFDASEIKVQTVAADVSASSFNFVWRSSDLWSRRLWIDLIDIGQVNVQVKQREKEEKIREALKLPKSIGLPLTVHVGKIHLESLTLNQQKVRTVWDSSVSYNYDNSEHKFSILALNTPWMTLDGQASLKNQSPFALAGKIHLDTDLEEVTAHGNITLSGSLEEPDLSAELSGDNLAITLAANPRPFEERTFKIINHLRFTAGGLNLHDFDERAPDAQLSMGILLDASENERLSGLIDLANLKPLPANQKGIPIRLVQGQLYLDRKGIVDIENFTAFGLKDGSIDLLGKIDLIKKELDLNLDVNQMRVQDVTDSTFPDTLNGKVHAKGDWTKPDFNWQLATETINSIGKLNFIKQEKGQQLKITEASIKTKAGGELKLAGTLDLFEKQLLKMKVTSKALSLKTLLPTLPVSSITSETNIDGSLAKPMTLNAKLNIAPSRLANANLQGNADVVLVENHLTKANTNITLGSNNIKTQGSFGRTSDKLNVNINAPNLKEAGLDLSGSLHLNGSVAGDPKNLKIDLVGKANALQYQNILRVNQLDTILKFSTDLNGPANIKINGKDVFILGKKPQDNTQIKYINLTLNGSGTKHQLVADTEMSLGGHSYKAQLNANGGLNSNYGWKGTVQKLDIRGALDILLQNAVSFEASADRIALGRASWSALGGSLNLDSFSWQKNQGGSTKGRANNLQVGKLYSVFDIPVSQNLIPTNDLTLKGDWDISYGNTLKGYAKIEHQAGDFLMPVSQSGRVKLPIGISKLLVSAQLQGNNIRINTDGTTKHGMLNGNLLINQNSNNFSLSSLSGQMSLTSSDLTTLRTLVPVGMNIGGSLKASASLSGSIGNPRITGVISGENLLYRERNLGFRLAEGTLRGRFSEKELVIDSLVFSSYNGQKNPSGTLTTSGSVQYLNERGNINMDVRFARFNIFEARPNRVLVVSGYSKLNAIIEPDKNGKADLKKVEITGDLKADFARIDLPKVGTPKLGDDVVFKQTEEEKNKVQLVVEKKLFPLYVNMKVDLGERFQFQGIGLDVMLEGKLTMSSTPQVPIRVVGGVNVKKGAYRAYGQDLITEKGTITFIGDVANPVLNIRAKRRYSPVGAGVEVKGPVSALMITLIADEAMSQKDKLAWLVLGRAPGSEQDEEALAASAGAWLAGSMNDRVRFFDDLGIGTKPKKTLKTGEVSPAEQMAIVGKYLSETLYVGYEYGLDSAESAVRLSYQLTRTLQLIFRVGTKATSTEVKYSIRFD